ncbi:MAG: ABC transporter permease [Terracidiphilus sp.]|jgi:predicted permease
MNQLLQDIRYTLRQLRKAPGFTLTVIITLALGIGANTAIFTLVHGILMSSLPVANPAQLYRVGHTNDCCVEGGFPDSDTGDFSIFSYDLYQYLRSNTPEFEQLAAVQSWQGQWAVRHGQEAAKSLHGEFVSGNYFSTLGLGAFAGRVFADADDTPNAPPSTVLSYQSWQGDFAGDPSIVGSTIYIQARPFTVVGIAPRGFYGDRITDTPPDFYMPLNTEPYVHGDSAILHHPDSHWLYPLGRVRAGTNIGGLQTRISTTLRQWLSTRSAYTANGGSAIIPKMHIVLSPGGGGIQTLQQQTSKGLTMLMILSSVVLLIACANIANLMLARSTGRRSEIAVRMALGAGRRRVTRQLLTESILLGVMGGLAGLGVAYAGSQAILALAFPDARNMPVSSSPSLPVLGFAFVVSLLTGILFGAGPAWLSSRAQPAEVLRGANRSTRDRSSIPQKALVVFQAALSLVLLAGAILMTKSLVNLVHQDLGLVSTNRYVLHLDPAGAGYTIDRLPALYRQIEDRFSAIPGVTHVGMALYSPLEGGGWGECVIQQGHGAPHQGEKCGSRWDRVSTQFLDSIGVPIVRGRGFSAQDTATSPQVVVVNETFVKHFFPKIVGVFRDFKFEDPHAEVRPVYLRPLSQFYTGYKEADMRGTETQSMFISSIVLSFNVQQPNASALIRQALAAVDPNLTVVDLRTFDSQIAGNMIQEKIIAQLTSLFGILSLILASVGLYGVMSYFVARRTSEIGIRMALGATRSSVVSMVMRGVLWQVVIGLVLGIPASLYAGYLMKSLLYGVGSYDPWAMVGAPFMIVLCATAAGFIPARRAASIEPMRALRTE